MRVIWDPLALDEFEEAIAYLRAEDQIAAEKLASAVIRAIDTLADGRFDGPARPLSTQDHVRVWWVAPYRLYYRREPGVLYILRLVHHRRRSP